MHIHGGGFIMGSGHPESAAAQLGVGLVAHSKSISRILEVDYRFSAAPPDAPKNPIPAAVLDSLAAYWYLIHDLGFAPSNIVIIGDAAGGNIALALVRHFVENQSRRLDLPRPAASSSARRASTSSREKAGNGAQTNQYVVPGSLPDDLATGSYVGFPRTYVSASADEAERMEAHGVEVRWDFPKDVIHDYMVLPWFERERTRGIKRLRNWVDGLNA